MWVENERLFKSACLEAHVFRADPRIMNASTFFDKSLELFRQSTVSQEIVFENMFADHLTISHDERIELEIQPFITSMCVGGSSIENSKRSFRTKFSKTLHHRFFPIIFPAEFRHLKIGQRPSFSSHISRWYPLKNIRSSHPQLGTIAP